LAYGVRVSYPVLWPDDGPFYEPFDRRHWPQTGIAAAVEEYSSRFEITCRNDNQPALEIHWAVVINGYGGFSLRAEWSLLREENLDASN
jgi:hypothetical protein